jgi:hypothetical protein
MTDNNITPTNRIKQLTEQIKETKEQTRNMIANLRRETNPPGPKTRG